MCQCLKEHTKCIIKDTKIDTNLQNYLIEHFSKFECLHFEKNILYNAIFSVSEQNEKIMSEKFSRVMNLTEFFCNPFAKD
jgi:hypothetical protein